MNAQIAIWLCVAITIFIFVIEIFGIKKLKRSVIEKIEWQKNSGDSNT